MEKNETIEAIEKKDKDEEISLLDLFAVLLKYKKMIIAVTLSGMLLAVIISIISLKMKPEKSFLPNVYTSSANMIINDSKSSGGSLMSALTSSGLGSIAGLAGISSSAGSTYSSLALYLTTSNPFLDAIVQNFNILGRKEFEKSKFPKSDSREFIKKNLTSSIDSDSGVFTISYKDIDPVFARDVVNFAVDWLSARFDELGVDQNKIKKENLEKNMELSFQEIQRLQNQTNHVASSVSNGNYIPSIALTTTKIQMELTAQQEVYKQLKTQYELLRVQMQSESPVFQIIERPEVADKKSGPSRGKLCIIITFASVFISIFLAFLLNAITNIKNDPEAMGKLKLKK